MIVICWRNGGSKAGGFSSWQVTPSVGRTNVSCEGGWVRAPRCGVTWVPRTTVDGSEPGRKMEWKKGRLTLGSKLCIQGRGGCQVSLRYRVWRLPEADRCGDSCGRRKLTSFLGLSPQIQRPQSNPSLLRSFCNRSPIFVFLYVCPNGCYATMTLRAISTIWLKNL